MSYLVLARKYRPQKFSEVIGQEHISELLEKSITSKRIAQAYLFCGPRGIGKTSCARILAKSLNCQKGPTLDPCGECASCKEIVQANSFDVLEIDGASNRGIDEIRTLRENVKFAPSYGRFKIYIIDEVHMLTMEAFNALLKTLEEPPEHVKFILATTSPNKVPSTIISRCQRFDFKRISVSTIIATLANLCRKENFVIEEEALFAIAKAASGSLRDALSILDQLSALSERTINAKDVFSMLGLVETELLFDLVDCLAQKNCSQAFVVFDHTIEQGKDIRQLGRDLVEHFRHLMIIKVGGKALGKLVDYPVSVKEMFLTQGQAFSLKEILNALETLIETQEISRIMESQRTPLEIAFAKLTYQKEISSPVSNPVSIKTRTVAQPIAAARAPSQNTIVPPPLWEPKRATMDVLEESISSLEEGTEGALDLEKIKRSWDAITYAISREKMSVATFLQEGSPFELKGSKLIIGFSQATNFHKESLEHKDNLRLVEKIFSEKLKTRMNIEFKIVENYKPQDDEPLVQRALETFKGKVVSKWHKE